MMRGNPHAGAACGFAGTKQYSADENGSWVQLHVCRGGRFFDLGPGDRKTRMLYGESERRRRRSRCVHLRILAAAHCWLLFGLRFPIDGWNVVDHVVSIGVGT